MTTTLDSVPNRIYSQYRGKPKLVAWLNICRELGLHLSDVYAAIRQTYDIDSQIGEQLDVIGRIVVIDRSYTGSVALTVYECNTDGACEAGDTSVQLSATNMDQDSEVSDELFRIVIRAKIAKNTSDGTIESILSACNILIPNAGFDVLLDNEDMSFSLEFSGLISDLEHWALLNASLIPKPQGVKFNGFFERYGVAWLSDTGDFECGNTSAECAGFIGV